MTYYTFDVGTYMRHMKDLCYAIKTYEFTNS
jgi:hypothetical protein